MLLHFIRVFLDLPTLAHSLHSSTELNFLLKKNIYMWLWKFGYVITTSREMTLLFNLIIFLNI